MNLRLSSQRFYFRLWFYVLPSICFLAITYARFHSPVLTVLSREYDATFYIGVAILTTLIWVLVAEHNHLCQLDDLFKEYSGIKKVFSSCVRARMWY
nr:hypothetical protein Hi04_10k_c4773_00027 [uncultured bacterium]